MTATNEMYEQIRVLLCPQGFAQLPKHELTDKLLVNLYSKDEAELVTACFQNIMEKVSFDKIRELTGLPEDKLADMLLQMMIRGKIRREGDADYYMLGYLPGVFEDYFTFNTDDPAKMQKVAEAHRALQKMGFNPEVDFPLKETSDFSNDADWRLIPAIELLSKTLEVNETVEVEHQILPFEILEELLSKDDVFSVTKCSCRNMAELAGEPCKRTDENFCVQAGPTAKRNIEAGIGKRLSYDEVMGVMKKAAQAGLVHSTLNMQDSPSFICNCCSCCCGALHAVKELNKKSGTARTNFSPKIDHEECNLCEICIGMCPMEVMHLDADDAGDKIAIDRDLCIGCGVCAVNCPEEAISLTKTSDNIPVQSRPALSTGYSSGVYKI
jgi:Pyruvate/2-oxoacid:ferredoxin oxidoreductase delta subunit